MAEAAAFRIDGGCPFIFHSWLQSTRQKKMAEAAAFQIDGDHRRGMGRTPWVAEAPFSIRSWRSSGSTLPSYFSSTSFGAQHFQIKKIDRDL
jgi:hypothetical protein